MNWLCVAADSEIPDLNRIIAAGWTKHVLGIGQFDALMTISRLLADQKPDGVILAGTCGTTNTADIGRIYACQHFAFPSVQKEDLPEFMEQSFSTVNAIDVANFSAATVLQNHGVSLDRLKFESNAIKIPQSYPQPIVENMEAASVALACKRSAIHFTALLCVTNEIGPNARTEWKKNFRSAGAKLAEALPNIVARA